MPIATCFASGCKLFLRFFLKYLEDFEKKEELNDFRQFKKNDNIVEKLK